MTTSCFDAYYEEFSMLLKQLATETKSKDIEKIISTCRHEILPRMDVEARNCQDSEFRLELTRAVEQSRAQLESLEEITSIQNKEETVVFDSHEQEKEELFGTLDVSETQQQDSHDPTCRIQRQNSALERARRSLASSEMLGLDIAEGLAQQREALQASRDKTNELSEMTQRAGDLVKSLNRPWWRG